MDNNRALRQWSYFWIMTYFAVGIVMTPTGFAVWTMTGFAVWTMTGLAV
jgi:hypothetical protein